MQQPGRHKLWGRKCGNYVNENVTILDMCHFLRHTEFPRTAALHRRRPVTVEGDGDVPGQLAGAAHRDRLAGTLDRRFERTDRLPDLPSPSGHSPAVSVSRPPAAETVHQRLRCGAGVRPKMDCMACHISAICVP